MVLDRQKIDKLTEDLSQYLSADDIYEIKKQIVKLRNNETLMTERLKYQERRKKFL